MIHSSKKFIVFICIKLEFICNFLVLKFFISWIIFSIRIFVNNLFHYWYIITSIHLVFFISIVAYFYFISVFTRNFFERKLDFYICSSKSIINSIVSIFVNVF